MNGCWYISGVAVLFWVGTHSAFASRLTLWLLVVGYQLVDWLFWGGVYDKRFLRPSKQGLRARLNGSGVWLFWGGDYGTRSAFASRLTLWLLVVGYARSERTCWFWRLVRARVLVDALVRSWRRADWDVCFA